MNTVGFAAAQIAEAEGVQFDLSELSMLGRFADSTPAVVVGADSELASFADVMEVEEPVRFRGGGTWQRRVHRGQRVVGRL